MSTVNFLIIVAITEVTKPFSGRLRPDFLALCQPSNLASPGADSSASTPLAESATALGDVHLGQQVTDCTNPDQEAVRDGRLVGLVLHVVFFLLCCCCCCSAALCAVLSSTVEACSIVRKHSVQNSSSVKACSAVTLLLQICHTVGHDQQGYLCTACCRLLGRHSAGCCRVHEGLLPKAFSPAATPYRAS